MGVPNVPLQSWLCSEGVITVVTGESALLGASLLIRHKVLLFNVEKKSALMRVSLQFWTNRADILFTQHMLQLRVLLQVLIDSELHSTEGAMEARVAEVNQPVDVHLGLRLMPRATFGAATKVLAPFLFPTLVNVAHVITKFGFCAESGIALRTLIIFLYTFRAAGAGGTPRAELLSAHEDDGAAAV